MSKCKVCGVTTGIEEDDRCGFCGGQSVKTFLCNDHRFILSSPSGTISTACEKCKDKKTTKGLWKLVQ